MTFVLGIVHGDICIRHCVWINKVYWDMCTRHCVCIKEYIGHVHKKYIMAPVHVHKKYIMGHVRKKYIMGHVHKKYIMGMCIRSILWACA